MALYQISLVPSWWVIKVQWGPHWLPDINPLKREPKAGAGTAWGVPSCSPHWSALTLFNQTNINTGHVEGLGCPTDNVELQYSACFYLVYTLHQNRWPAALHFSIRRPKKNLRWRTDRRWEGDQMEKGGKKKRGERANYHRTASYTPQRWANTTKCKVPEEGGTAGRVGHQRASSPTRSCACQFWAAAGTNAGEQKVTAGGSQPIRGPERDSVSSTPELSSDRAPHSHVHPTRLCATPSPT